jgi:beta-glucosidase
MGKQAWPYQDASLEVDARVDDLLARTTVEDEAGLMFHAVATIGPLDEPGLFDMPSMRSMLERRITHFSLLLVPSARELAEWQNEVQAEAARQGLGIPVTFSSDPRHAFTNNPYTSFLSGPFSQWPEPLGLAAIGSTELARRFAEVVRDEYLAVGIRTALHPQVDLATEPRWARQSTTFGEDVELTARLADAYVRGLRGDDPDRVAVSPMAKHFPGGGAQKDGEDPHFAYGREQVYPAGRLDLHLEPFRAAIAAGATQVMTYYGVPTGTDLEEVAFSFNRQVITGLLREQLGFDGVVCTDWGVLSNTCWGVEHLSIEERTVKALDAGVDQFGGETLTDVVVALVASGAVTRERITQSARRLLREKFRLGLFDDPYVDPERATAVVGSAAGRDEGLVAQSCALTLLRNPSEGPAHLPLCGGTKVHVVDIDESALEGRASVVGPDDADVAIVRLQAPWEPRGEPGEIESYFHAGSLAFSSDQLEALATLAERVPVVACVYLDRPAILADLTDIASALVVDFGATDEAIVRVLFGEAEPLGRLPFDIPSSMDAVERSAPDAPFDTADPTFRFGFGLRYGAEQGEHS